MYVIQEIQEFVFTVGPNRPSSSYKSAAGKFSIAPKHAPPRRQTELFLWPENTLCAHLDAGNRQLSLSLLFVYLYEKHKRTKHYKKVLVTFSLGFPAPLSLIDRLLQTENGKKMVGLVRSPRAPGCGCLVKRSLVVVDCGRITIGNQSHWIIQG